MAASPGQGPSPTVGILLLYRPDHLARAMVEFQRFLTSLRHPWRLILVMNQDLRSDLPPLNDNMLVVKGDNRTREFSGWNVGLAEARRLGWLAVGQAVVLANDSFCHHNRFGPITRFAFRRALRRMTVHPEQPTMVGEIHGGDTLLELNNVRFRTWISTYLFAVNEPLLSVLGDSVTPDIDPHRLVPGGASEGQFFSAEIPANTRRRLAQWLFGESGRPQWYGARALDPMSAPGLAGKARSIVCEWNLSAHAQARGARSIGAFDSVVLRVLRRLEQRGPVT